MAGLSLRGIFPPVPTPFEGGEVAPARLRRNIELWNTTGLHGYVVLGSNGEYVHLNERERLLCIETVAAAAGPGRLRIAGTGCESTDETIRFTRAAAAAGAQAALVVTPHYYRGRMDATAFIEHYTRVADASPIPVIIYNVPGNTAINLDPAVPIALSEHPNIVGMKNSSGLLGEIAEVIAAAKPGFQVLAGSGSFVLPALAVGGVGGVLALANVAPRECVRLFDRWHAGEVAEAKALQLRLVELNKAVTARWGVPALKAALDLLGYFGGEPRRPLRPLGDRERMELARIMVRAGILAE
ncbi:MAG TPA: dihydrodipicolinate synthase family protein [Bacillota bacterium]